MRPLAVGTRLEAPLIEVFASIQGEGLYVGEPQVFLRLRGCPLRCRWCDTPGSWTLSERASAESRGGASARIDARGGARREFAWATPFQAACWISEVEPGAPRTVSVTGGEPLVWPDFVAALKGFVGGRRVHLETAGAHPRALAKVLDAVDHVSLDLKLPDDLSEPVEIAAPGESDEVERAPRSRPRWAEVRAQCLRLVRGRDACAKVIVAGDRPAAAFDELFESVAEHAPALPVIVQPVTPRGDVPAPTPGLLTALVERARSLELAVRVVPQVHRALGLP